MITEHKFQAVRKALANLREEEGNSAVDKGIRVSLEATLASLLDSDRMNIEAAMEQAQGWRGVGRVSALEIISQVGMVWDRKG